MLLCWLSSGFHSAPLLSHCRTSQGSIMPSVRGMKNDRKGTEELLRRRREDYAWMRRHKEFFPCIDEEHQPKKKLNEREVFPCIEQGCLPKKKTQSNFSPADVRRKLKFKPHPHDQRKSSYNKRYSRPLTPLGEFSRVAPYEKVEEKAKEESSPHYDEADPDIFVIGSTPKKEAVNGNKTTSCKDRSTKPEVSRPLSSLEIRDLRKPTQKVKPHAREPSASEMDLLETSADEDDIFHPHPDLLVRYSVDQPQVTRTVSYRDATRPILEVSRDVSVPSMSSNGGGRPQPSRSVECARIKPWGFRWANKVCRSVPIVKHQ